jgi:hypothetical protein
MLRLLMAGLLSATFAAPLSVTTASAKSAAEIFQSNRQAVVRIEMAADPASPNREPMTGTGFIINPNGIVLTASHNLKGYVNPNVTPIKARIGAMNGQQVEADLVSSDSENDIAILKLRSASAVQSVTRGDSSALTSGARLTVIGFRSSIDIAPVEVSFATQSSNLGPKLWTINAPGVVFGMSGAPVFNSDGAVIGMVVGGFPGTDIAFFYPEQSMYLADLAWLNPRCDAGPLPMQYSLYVLDNTDGIMKPDKKSMKPMLETIRSHLLAEAKQWDSKTRCFGGVAVGGKGPPAPNDAVSKCGRVAPFHPLARFDFARLSNGLNELYPIGNDRPLIEGIFAALAAYQPYRQQFMSRPNDRFLFTIITTGPDTCGYDDPAKFLDTLDTLLSQRELKAVLYDNRTLPIMLQLAEDSGAGFGAYRKTSAYQRREQPLAILVVKDNDTLATALGAIAEMMSPEQGIRSHGCEGLIGLFKRQEDSAGVEKVRLRCRG